jgi:hypothetical protein
LSSEQQLTVVDRVSPWFNPTFTESLGTEEPIEMTEILQTLAPLSALVFVVTRMLTVGLSMTIA